MYESSGLHFSKTTTGIQLGSNISEKLTLIMTSLTDLRATLLACSFRLVLEGKAGKEIPDPSRLEFLENLLPLLRTVLPIPQKL